MRTTKIRMISTYIVVAILVVLAGTPLVLVFLTSVKPLGEIYTTPPTYLPSRIDLDGYLQSIGQLHKEGSLSYEFPRYIGNSLLVSSVVTVTTLLVSVPAGYGLARFRFRGRSAISLGVLLAYLMPTIVLIIPLFVIFNGLHLIDNYLSLIISYHVLTVPLCIWFLRGYFTYIPWELEEAAIVDGCSRIGALVRVILPVTLPAIAAVSLFAFLQCWQEYVFALVFTGATTRTGTIGFLQFLLEAGIDWSGLMAATLLYSIPVAVIFLVFQKQFVQGLTAGSVKA